MKQSCISFSAPMARARRAGIKTQTRRVVKSLRHPFGHILSPEEIALEFNGLTAAVSCPYGKPGDRLIVKEAAWMWCAKVVSGLTKKTKKPKVCWVESRNVPPIYCADHPEKPDHLPDGQMRNVGAVTYEWRKKIARFLPAWASRDTLEITGIRVERLNDISEADAIAEGVPLPEFPGDGSARLRLSRLWESINGPGSWEMNHWVWVVEFKRFEKGLPTGPTPQ